MFEHQEVQLPDDAKFKISPSGIADFFNNPVIWYKDHILGEKQFTGSTASVLGTICHYFAEQYGIKSYDEINAEVIKALAELEPNPDIDKNEVASLYPDMVSMLISEYLSNNIPTERESSLVTEVKKGIYVGGTCDALKGTVVTDYKNVSKKPSDTIPFNYLIQLLAYAYMYREQGTPVDTVRLVYTVRPTKTLPVRVFVVSKVITQDDWDLIENTLELIADTVLKHFEDPSLDYLLFKSMQFKQKEKPKLFKN